MKFLQYAPAALEAGTAWLVLSALEYSDLAAGLLLLYAAMRMIGDSVTHALNELEYRTTTHFIDTRSAILHALERPDDSCDTDLYNAERYRDEQRSKYGTYNIGLAILIVMALDTLLF